MTVDVETVARAMAPSAWLPFDPQLHGSPVNREFSQKWWLRIAANGITAIREAHAIVPRELDDVAAYRMREAYRNTRSSGVSGMTIDAQFRAEFAREIAAYAAMIAAAEAEGG